MGKMKSLLLAIFLLAPAMAADQTKVGEGNQAAAIVAAKSPLVRSAMSYLIQQAHEISDLRLRLATLDILTNPRTCVAHRANLTVTQKQAIVAELIAAGLVNPADGAAITGGVFAGIFPPISNDADGGNSCPQLPQPFLSAPGGGDKSHHSYPGGLAVHESNNERSDQLLSAQYYASYLEGKQRVSRVEPIDHNVIVAAPIWHDWAKAIVFQWNADGGEFAELNFGGAGATDNNGLPGDSRTGAHHILSIAEAMKRGLSPLEVITQASAHAAPTLGNEFKVVNWLRAAAIIARIDPVEKGYLSSDAQGQLRLPPVNQLGAGLDLNAAGQTNLRVEYTLHNQSDADYTFSIPAIAAAQALLAHLAPEFGYDPASTAIYNTRFRNPALSFVGGEKMLMLYGSQGLPAVEAELRKLRARGIL
jgi:hypothetical protein